MRKLTFIGFLCVLLLVSCSQEKYPETSSETNKAGVVSNCKKRITKVIAPVVQKMKLHFMTSYIISL